MKRKREYDFWLLLVVLILLTIGVIMVFSASSYYASLKLNRKFYFLVRQILWGAVGIGFMYLFSNIDYRRIALISPVLMGLSIILLLLVLFLGSDYNGSRRWFSFGIITFQPSEFAKLSLILFLSFSLSKNGEKLKYFFRGLVPYLLLVGVVDFLLYKEPHMSCIILMTLVAVIIIFCAGARIWHFILLAAPTIVVGWEIIKSDPERAERLLSFTDPFKYPQGSGFQVVNSLYAIASGSLFGRGLGKSLQKYLYIPEPHNDFIFAIIAEELGFIGAFTIIMLFVFLVWRGIKIAMNAPDMLGSLIAIGVTSLIAIEVIINIAVVTSTIPVTGMPLPFISSGGTSLLFMLMGVGILLNISKNRGSVYVPAIESLDGRARRYSGGKAESY
jgi:cell division protein FtsW